MPVRYKFRSSVAFDTADLGGRPSISVGELRAKILRQKNLQICRDFDLVITDSDTGQAFDDDDLQIMDGSSVIIKRVPAGLSQPPNLVAADAARSSSGMNVGLITTTTVPSPPKNVYVENFDDFGIELYPDLEVSVLESDADVVKSTASKDGNIPSCQNFSRRDLCAAKSGGAKEEHKNKCSDVDPEQIKTSKGEHKLEEAVGTSSPAMLNTDLPAELKCPLCKTFFKEAVMIPCCQHSFCDKCIRLALVEKSRCPKCSSLKCTTDDLLPNLSLRQAIEHFLEAQVAINGTDNCIPRYAPDVESGIHGKDVCCAVSIRQEEPVFPDSPSATGKGSNQVMMESAYESKRITGGNSSRLYQNIRQKEIDSLAMQIPEGPGVKILDGSERPSFRNRKGDRTCYRCGSANHLVRDCPVASNPYPVLQTGDAAFSGGMSAYGHPYWHGARVPHVGPYASIYGAPGYMPFDPSIVPVSPFGIPSYMPSLYADMPVPYGFMGLGGAQPPIMAGADRPLTRAEFMDLQDAERKNKFMNAHPDRDLEYESISEDHHYNGSRRLQERTRRVEDINSSCSDEHRTRLKKHSLDKHNNPVNRRSDFVSEEEISLIDARHEKRSHLPVYGKDHRRYYSEKSNSEVQDQSESSDCPSRKRHHHKSHYKKHEKRSHCCSDSSRKSHHHSRKEKSDDVENAMKDRKRQSHRHHSHSGSGFEHNSSSGHRRLHMEHRHHSHSGSGFEHNSSSDHRRLHMEEEFNKNPVQKVKSTDELLQNDRWEMVDCLDGNYREKYCYHKRKRTC